MRMLASADLVTAYRALGIERGDIVHVQSDLRRVGPVEAPMTVEGLCTFHLSALREAVGSEGTITTCTSFEDYGRYGTPFVLETSPSRVGMLSEYIRIQPGAVRSLHPIMSVTGLGPRAEEICGGPHFDGFGYQSPWGYLHRTNAKILTLGMGAQGGGTTFFHYVEHLHGVPYQYTKLYNAPVFAGGKPVPGTFTLSVRYLDFGIVNTPVRVKTRLVEEGLAREARTGRTQSWCAPAQVIVDRMMQYFSENRWVMLETPPTFRLGSIPMDGCTGDLQVVYDRHSSGEA